MNKLYHLTQIVFFLFLSFTTQAQNRFSALPMHCGTDEYMARIIKENPEVVENMRKNDDLARSAAMNFNNNKSAQVQVTIPVVFHVIWKTAAQNISDTYILAQLSQLNKDYSKTNSDTGSVPAAFKPVAANTDIQFCLAQRDPNGNPTTGITRTQTAVNVFCSGDSMKHNSTGGHDIWDRNLYLNIWICNLGCNLLGYATFPGGNLATDGVVVHYGTVGSILTPNPFNWGSGINYKWGRSATHETGHWLQLKHIFEGGCVGLNNNTCLNQGDQVCDTPPEFVASTGGPTYGCPVSPTQNTCTETSPFPSPYTSDQLDMWMNYMDYVDDDCMYMFTLGQKGRIQSLFNNNGSRLSLNSSNGCLPVGINEPGNLNVFSVYPNPSDNDVKVQIHFIQPEKFEMAVVNSIGQVIYLLKEENSYGNKYTLPLANQPKGFYFIRVSTTKGTSSQKIILI